MKQSPAFTLIEILVVIAIVGIVGGAGFTSYFGAKSNQQLRSTAEIFAENLRRMHIFSREVKDNKVWGIMYQSVSSYRLVSATPVSQLVGGVKTPVPPITFQVDQAITLDAPISFSVAFNPIWFTQGAGGAYGQTEIVFKNSGQLMVRVTVLPTGTIEVH